MGHVTAGHKITFALKYLDQHGNPMKSAVTPDSAPVWTHTPSDPAVDDFSAAADGSSAVLMAKAAGSDTVAVSVVVGGATFSASDLVTIDEEPQVLTSVAIDETVE